jgi:hypothetical protein
MTWFNDKRSISFKLFAIFTETVELYRRPTISILFNDERRNQYLELVKQFYILLQDVYRLECESDEKRL